MICVKFMAFCDLWVNLWIRLATLRKSVQVLVLQTCVDLHRLVSDCLAGALVWREGWSCVERLRLTAVPLLTLYWSFCGVFTAQEIQLGESDVVIAGGTENMSQAPYALRDARFGTKLGLDLKVKLFCSYLHVCLLHQYPLPTRTTDKRFEDSLKRLSHC